VNEDDGGVAAAVGSVDLVESVLVDTGGQRISCH